MSFAIFARAINCLIIGLFSVIDVSEKPAFLNARAKRLKRGGVLCYSNTLFLTFIIFCREFNVPFLFPFLFLVSL
jgi:hypothetical protein